MATIAPDQNQLNQQQQPNAGGGGQVINSTGGGGATGVQSGQTGAGGAAYSPARAPLTGQPNISQYLAANQGAGQQLSQGIQNNLQTQNQALNQQIGSYNQQLGSQYYNPLFQNLGQNAQNVTQTAFQNPQQLLDAYNAAKTQSSNQPLTDPAQQQALQNYNQFQQLASGGYNQNISDYGNTAQQYGYNLQNPLASIQQQAAGANTEMGRNQLLQNIAQPGYNLGEQGLDALFLGGTPGVANQLQQGLTNIANQAAQNVNAFNTTNQQQVAALQGLSASDKAAITNLFMNGIPGAASPASTNQYLQQLQSAPMTSQGTPQQPNITTPGQVNPATGLVNPIDRIPGLNAPAGPNYNQTGLNQIAANVQQEIQNALAAQPGILQNLQQAAAADPFYAATHPANYVAPGNFTAAQLNQLGLQDNLNAYGVNLGQYISATPLANLTSQGQAAAVASPDEFNRYQALNQLLGQATGTGTAQPSIFGNATTAAATPFNPVTFDTSAFNTAIAQGKQNAQTALQTDVQNVINSINNNPWMASELNYVMPNFTTNLMNDFKNNYVTDQFSQYIQQGINAINANSGGWPSSGGMQPKWVGADNSWLNQFNQSLGQNYTPLVSDILGTNENRPTFSGHLVPKGPNGSPVGLIPPPAPGQPASWNPSSNPLSAVGDALSGFANSIGFGGF